MSKIPGNFREPPKTVVTAATAPEAKEDLRSDERKPRKRKTMVDSLSILPKSLGILNPECKQ